MSRSSRESAAVLALEDGSLFYGRTRAREGMVCAEVVFNTSVTGYQEICTDPSYENQFVLFTTSHVGNVGVNTEDFESNKVAVKAIIVKEMSTCSSNWRSEKSFERFLYDNNVPWIEGIDTRKLTRHLRNAGAQNACLMIGALDADLAIWRAKVHVPIIRSDARLEDDAKSRILNPLENALRRIYIYDFGVKSAILRALLKLGCAVHVIPSSMSADELLALHPDGIVLSNGSGDPAAMGKEIEEIRKFLFSGIPVLGICLGCQLIALACGGSTKKMKFGHHGTNHPVYGVKQKKVCITSQNHNFIVDEATLPAEFEITHVSLFDGSIQGIKSKNYPVMGFQGHPEGSPGPQDMEELFGEFLKEVSNAIKLQH